MTVEQIEPLTSAKRARHRDKTFGRDPHHHRPKGRTHERRPKKSES
jgi:hypothetical protein